MYSLSETPRTTAGPSWSLSLDGLDMDLAASVPDTPRPLPVADEPGRRRSARSALGLVLSLAVHAALIALAAVPPDAPPMVIMEISLAMGGFSGPGHATGAPGPGVSGTAEPSPGAIQAAAAPPIAATPQEPPPSRPSLHPSPRQHRTQRPFPKKPRNPRPTRENRRHQTRPARCGPKRRQQRRTRLPRQAQARRPTPPPRP